MKRPWRTSSTNKRRIEGLRGLAEDPFLIGILGERKRLSCRPETFRQRAARIRKIRAPGDPWGAERVDRLSEERFRRAFAPGFRRHVDRRDLQVNLLVLGEREEVGRLTIGRPVLERRARQVVE